VSVPPLPKPIDASSRGGGARFAPHRSLFAVQELLRDTVNRTEAVGVTGGDDKSLAVVLYLKLILLLQQCYRTLKKPQLDASALASPLRASRGLRFEASLSQR
jgi:hypothetical protein